MPPSNSMYWGGWRDRGYQQATALVFSWVLGATRQKRCMQYSWAGSNSICTPDTVSDIISKMPDESVRQSGQCNCKKVWTVTGKYFVSFTWRASGLVTAAYLLVFVIIFCTSDTSVNYYDVMVICNIPSCFQHFALVSLVSLEYI